MTGRAGYFYHAGKGELVIVFRLDEWPARNLLAKRFSPDRRVLTRHLTPDEAQSLAGARRLFFTRYRDWPGLFEDEAAVGVAPEIIDTLRAFSGSHPLRGGKK